jgi:hypothetical protein
MPELVYSDAELGLSPGWDENLDPNIRRELRSARQTAKHNEELSAELATYKRKDVLSRAGIPQDNRGDAFAKLYEGPVDDAEKVKAAYEELFGKVEAPAAGGTEPLPGEDSAATARRIAEANANGTNAGASGPVDLADAIRAAKTPEEVKNIIAAASKLPFAPGQMIPRLPDDS